MAVSRAAAGRLQKGVFVKKGQQNWRRLDNTAKIFPVIANENFSNVFRVAVSLKETVKPELLQQALEDVMPSMEGFRVKLRRGFFWYYFEYNKRTPVIERETTNPCKYIDPHSNELFLFRVSYYERRINLEMFHAITDGLGAMNFLREITYRYLQLSHQLAGEPAKPDRPAGTGVREIEDSYLKNYRKMKNESYSSRKAYRLTGEPLPLGSQNLIHGRVKIGPLKKVCRAHGVSITKYLTACMIWSVYQVYLEGNPCKEHIGINLPINLRSMFDSETMANFFAVVGIDFLAEKEQYTFDEILETVSSQMDEKIVKEKLEERISYNVSNEKKWYTRILPLFVKWAGMNVIFRLNDRAHTMTLSNLGPITVEPEYEPYVDEFFAILGVSARQPMKCVICSYKDEMMVSFASIFTDAGLQQYFFDYLEKQGIPVNVEGNGASPDVPDKKMYPEVRYDPAKWKKLVNVFYLTLLALGAVLAVVNYTVAPGIWWSGIAIACMAYSALTVRYSITRHANLGSKIMIQTLGAQALLVIIDNLLGYNGWSVNYAVPSTILFADFAIVFLIIVNRLNWQSYLMYQITMTIFSFIPIVLWALGWITKPLMAIITVILTVLALTLVILMGDRSVKRELIRRFHL